MRPPILLAAIPDLAVGLSFLAIWISPRSFPDGAVSYYLLVMLLEFIIIHSSAFMGNALLAPAARSRRALVVVGFGLFYSLFLVGFSLSFHTAWPLSAFWLLTANRLSSLLLVSSPSDEDRRALMRGWAATGILYLMAAFITVLLPMPRLGLTAAFVETLALPGGGLWIEQPHRAIAMGFFYFTAVGISELFEHRWTASGIPARQAAA